MSSLEAELARFEAELASVQAPQQPSHSAPPQASYAAPSQHSFAAPSQAAYAPAAHYPPQYATPATLPPAPAPVQYAAHPQQYAPMPTSYGGPQQPPSHMYPAQPLYYPPPDPYAAAAAAAVPVPTPSIALAKPLDPELAKKLKEDLMGKGKVPHAAKDGPKQKPPAVKRTAAGETWWDPTLLEWPEGDFRIFVGDLGNEVNDEILTKAFQKYASFAKAKVVRDRRTNKSKGYGFVSFMDSNDFAKALREMDGKYIGNRPCKLRKSDWAERSAPMKGKRKDTGEGGQQPKKAKSILHK